MSRFHTLEVAGVRPETREAVTVEFVVPPALADLFRFQPGQHLTLRAQVDGDELRRSYSICAAPSEGVLRIAIKRVAGGRFSQWAIEHLAAGMHLDVLPPAGHFGLAIDSTRHGRFLAIAAGSGITPILSIVRATLEGEPASTFTLIYGNRASSTVMFREALADLKDRFMERFNLIHVLSRERQDIDLLDGRIDSERCARLLQHWVDDTAVLDACYVCGPLALMESVCAALAQAGVPAARIRRELFATSLPGVARPRHDVDAHRGDVCRLRIVYAGTEHALELDGRGQSLLDAALQAGIDVPYSCRGGVCATCRCRVVEGEVDMDTNFALEDYEIARGFRLACQSFPASPSLTVDFDAEG